MKSSAPGELNKTANWDGGVGWIAHPDEEMQRASYAIIDTAAGDEDTDAVYPIDPIDAPGLDEWLEELGDVAGVVILLDRHRRDAAELANRYDVAVHIPSWMSGVTSKIDAPVQRLGDEIAGFEIQRLIDNPLWQEAALYHPEDKILLTPESLGTAEYYCAPGELVGVHPALRLFPPKQLGELDVERLLVGHGASIETGATEQIQSALSGSRSRAPQLYLKTLKSVVQ
jgi:hypothetical protein